MAACLAAIVLIPAAAAEAPAGAGRPRPPITTLSLFVHCLGDGMDRALTERYTGLWRELFTRCRTSPRTCWRGSSGGWPTIGNGRTPTGRW